jgi:arginyl-tRNA synthetase
VALQCFKLAKDLGRAGKDAAPAVAAEIATGVKAPFLAGVEAVGPFVNFRLDPVVVAREVLGAVWTKPRYGDSTEGAGKTIVIDFSAPNIRCERRRRRAAHRASP